MKQNRIILGRKLMSFLLTLAMVVGLMPGMSLTAYAATETYTALKNDATVVHFHNSDWYIIADDSTSATEGTVTLLSADESFGMSVFNSEANNSYNASAVKAYLSRVVAGTAGEGKPNFSDVAGAIEPVDLTTYNYNSTTEVKETTDGAKLYLLDTAAANGLHDTIKSDGFEGVQHGFWWLRSPGQNYSKAAFGVGETGEVYAPGDNVTKQFGVRPALKLDLSKVTFDSVSKTFSLNSASNTTEYTTLQVGDVLRVGDTINSTTEYDIGGFSLVTDSGPWTMVRADFSVSDSELNVTESATGAYYLFKGQGEDLYTVGYDGQEIFGAYFKATETSDGIYVTSISGPADYQMVSFAVYEPVTGVTLTPNTAQTIDIDGTVAFTASITPNNASDKTVKWSVGGTNASSLKLYSDENCTTEVGTDATSTLTVYAKGISAGNATVTATSNADNTKSASCDVTVNAAASTSISFVKVTDASQITADNIGTCTYDQAMAYAVANLNTLKVNLSGSQVAILAFKVDSTIKAIFVDSVSTETDDFSPENLSVDSLKSWLSQGDEIYLCASSAPAAYSVTITQGSNMTWTTTSGAASQIGLSGAMTDVVYTADEGYYFPTTYSVTAVNGISVTRNSYTQITVSGTPTADAAITLIAPTAKTTPDAPTSVTAVDCTTSDNNDGKLTGVTTAMEYKKSDAESWTSGTGSDITGLVPGTYYVRVKATDEAYASGNQELTIDGANASSDNTVTWSDISDISIEDWESVTKDGVTVTLGSYSSFMYGNLNLGSCIFTASQGGISGITIQTKDDLEEPYRGWPSGWIANGKTLTWNGDPAVEVSLDWGEIYDIQQITFTMSDTGTGTKSVWTNETIEIDGEVTVNRRIIVNGNVTLNLKEGSKLIANAGINVSAGNSLTIQGSGELIASIDEQQSLQADHDMAAIGGNDGQDAGTITITGGTIEAYGGANAAGIGGGDSGNGGTINISGGTVTAIGGSFGAGIGGGNGGNGGTVNISGGTVIATGGQYGKNGGSSSGIGKNGYGSDDGSLTLGDGVVMQVSSDNTTWSEYNGSDRARYMKSHIPAIDILVTGLTLDKTTTQIIDVGNKVSFTATVAPDNASDKTVKWSVGGTDADAVTLYSDEACETAVTLDTATSTLTVYAKGVSAGSATVTCTSNADSTKSASCVVTVNVVASYPLWVGGVQVTSANKDDVLGNTDEGATVSYDVDTNTLTLNGADIAAGYTDPTYNDTSGIYYSGNDSLSIVLSTGTDNKVGVNGNVQIGIKSSNNIRISGAGKLTVKGSGNYSVGIDAYSLTIEAAEVNVEGALNGIQTQKYGYGVNIISGKVNAIGQTGTGIHSGLRDVNDQTNAVTIGENATVVAIGGNKAINYLKNAIAGTGWTDPEDNTSKTTISISSEGQSIDTLKKMAFPKLPASTVTTPPEANNLTFTGSAQELVIAGVASNGEMQYAIGTNTTTVPTTGWSASIPTATEAGTYYVWYKVVGDENHNDTDAANVPVVIAKADPDYTVPTGLTAVYGDTLQDVTLPAGWTWADADQIVGDAGTNTFKANYVPNDVTNYNSVENVDVTVSVSKGNGAAAVAPEVTAWTSDYVFAEAVNGQEYVIVKKGETPDWSKAVTPDDGSVTFTGLTPATEYSIYTRVKETDNTLASETEKVDVMTSLIGWETRGEAKTGETITIIPDPENAEGLTWQWYYAEENEEGTVVRGEAIKGETGSSYVVKESDVGKYLYFVISKDGKELETGYAGPVKIAINVTVALDGWAYGEAPNTPVVTGNTGNGKVSFTYAKKGSEEPESETVPTLPGTYTVFAYVEESGDYAFGYAEADFTITKGTPEVTTPKARNLVYTGASQELVEAGVAVGGEMQYAFGTETVATQPYTTSIPTATDAGTYYVWYKAVGDENHSDSVPVCVPVVIESKESVEGEVTFNKGEGSDEIPETLVESVESSDLTEFAKTQKEESKEVKVELEITPKREADIVQTSVDGTKQIAEGLFVGFDTEKVVTEYFDIDLTKYVDDVKQDNIADTGSPIEIALKYDKTKMFDPVVVRTHKGETVEFSKLNARPAKADYKDATYYVGDGVIYLYSQFFSDYAIIYSTVKTYNVDIVTGTSDKISKTVAEDSKVDLPTGLSKSGYTFSGWYSDEAYTKVWNANDPVTADTTIYAKWTKNTAPYVPSTPVETPTAIPTPTATPTPTETPTVTPAPVKDSITAEEAASGSIKLNAGLKVYPKKSDIVVKWGKIDNADRYVIYAAYCKKGRKCAKIATLDGDANTYIFSELNGKAINTKKNIKLYVVAYRKVNGKYKKITRSITAHIVGSGSKKYSNVKGINVESTKITLSLDDNTAAPSSYTLNPVAVLKDSSKKMLLHTAEFRYVSSKSSVATVGKDGTITAKGIGTCYIYVYAQNGYAKRIKVTVK